MSVAILVPRRADGGERDRLWTFVRDWWSAAFPAWKIVEGHHDDGPFNRGAAINAAAADAGPHDVFVVADGDVIADPALLAAAVGCAEETGRACFAFDRYLYLTEQASRAVLAGTGPAEVTRGARDRRGHLSSLLAVPWTLWGRCGGFDERFVGWGAEDDAFATSARVLGGGLDRIAGTAYHLHHAIAPGLTRTTNYGMSRALLNRYDTAREPRAMRSLIDERGSDLLLLVQTDGRRDCIARTIPTLRHLHGLTVGRKLIVDDSGDLEYQAWLRHMFPGWELYGSDRRDGYPKAVARARALAVESGQPWVWWHEDDFVLNGPTDVGRMAQILGRHSDVQQVALLRQPWWQGEKDAGGIIAERPAGFTERDGYVEHALFWTQNPHLVAREHLAEHRWPLTAGSEARYGHEVLRDGRVSAYLGGRDDEPRVTHIGAQRAGANY